MAGPDQKSLDLMAAVESAGKFFHLRQATTLRPKVARRLPSSGNARKCNGKNLSDTLLVVGVLAMAFVKQSRNANVALPPLVEV